MDDWLVLVLIYVGYYCLILLAQDVMRRLERREIFALEAMSEIMRSRDPGFHECLNGSSTLLYGDTLRVKYIRRTVGGMEHEQIICQGPGFSEFVTIDFFGGLLSDKDTENLGRNEAMFASGILKRIQALRKPEGKKGNILQMPLAEKQAS